MSKEYLFAYSVTRDHPYIEPTDPLQKRDSHAEAFMALVKCAASNPARLFSLRDDELIIYKNEVGNTFIIKLQE